MDKALEQLEHTLNRINYMYSILYRMQEKNTADPQALTQAAESIQVRADSLLEFMRDRAHELLD